MSNSETPDFHPVNVLDMEAPEALDAIIQQAIDLRASDLFLLAQDGSYSALLRRMGTIEPVLSMPRELGMHMVSLVKASAGMDLGEKRRPIDGRWAHRVGEHEVDFRINSIGTHFGEDLAMRLFVRSTALHNLSKIGLVDEQEVHVRSMLDNHHGLILVTGPTGSGKSTTLYSCLKYLNDGTRKINTLEDPIEYTVKGLCQSQVEHRLRLDFSELLRGAMRQSPDVIMIGEIRDPDTANIAVRAANSGHLVLSTLHAPVSSGAVQAMLAFGVHPFFLANALLGVVAQRLVRVLNPETRIEFDISHSPETFAQVRHLLEPGQGDVIYAADPNDPTSQQGYVGLTGLFEVMHVEKELREMIATERQSSIIRRRAVELGMIDFHQAALIKVAQGITSTEEIVTQVPVEDHAIDPVVDPVIDPLG